MNTVELQHFLDITNTNKNHKLKVCAIDKLKEVRLLPNLEYGFVVNLSDSSSLGSHWTGLYIGKGGTGKSGSGKGRFASYCDSFGFFPRGYHIEDFIKKNCTRYEYNDQQLQQISSKVCGMYAACFILHISNGGSLQSFIDKFCKRLKLNDIFIQKNYTYYLRNFTLRNFLANKKKDLARKRIKLRNKMLRFTIPENENNFDKKIFKRKIFHENKFCERIIVRKIFLGK